MVGTGVATEQPSVCTRLLTPSLVGINWSAIKNVDAVIHLAANNDTLCDDEEEMMLANFHAPTMLFKHCLDMGCRTFVYASSASVYGNAPHPQTEDGPLAPLNFYAQSKLRFETFARNFAEQNSVSVTGLRYFNVYGPGEQHKGRRASMVSQIVEAAKCGRAIKLFKHGEQRRDWVHVDDVAEINIQAMGLQGHNVVNVGTGTPVSFREIIEIVNKNIQGHHRTAGLEDCEGLNVEWVDCPFADAYQCVTQAEIEKADALFGRRLWKQVSETVPLML